MNEIVLNNEESENKKFLSLKEENEDNLIENISKPKENIIDKNNEKIFNEDSKYKLNYTYLFEYINHPSRKKLNDQNEYFLNLLSMPKEIDLKNKVLILDNLRKLYKKTGQKELLIRACLKLEKIRNKGKDVEIACLINSFREVALILSEEYQNYFYSFKYITLCIEMINNKKSKTSENEEVLITQDMSSLMQSINNYIEAKKILFMNESKDETAKKIDELTDKIMSEQNNKETNENDENNKYLYVINKEWVINLVKFIKPFRKYSLTDNKDLSIKNHFEFKYISEIYLDDKKKVNEKDFHPFPGPIDNFKITSFKDSWKDNENLDENDYIKKNSEYYLVNYEDWNILASHFNYTNIIRRKKDNLDLKSFKFILFDKRIETESKNINLLKERYIQVNKGINIGQLKQKIFRCADNILKKTKKQKQISFYILDRDNYEILIEMAFGYLFIPKYESLYIKKVKFNDDQNLDYFFSVFNQKKHILIAEIIKKDDNKYIIDKENYKCNICGKLLENENEIYKCEICHFSVFCSKSCANNSDLHRTLDKKLKQIMEKKFSFSEMISDKYDYLLTSGNKGRVNLSVDSSDESFFIGSIQCLSHTLSLTKYFITKSFKQEQNPEKCKLSEFYYKLINASWDYGSKSWSINVSDFCKKIDISNINNLDSYDFIIRFLNKLNEELNRVSGDYNEEIEEQKEGESDEEASRRFKINAKKKNDSIVTDLFQGQFKESTKCVFCSNIYNRYPHFLSIGLPLPDKKYNIQIKLFTSNLKYYYVNIKLNENTEMRDILFKSMEYLNKSSYIKYLLNNKTKEGIFNHNITEVPESILYNNLQFVEVNKEFKIVNIRSTSYNNSPTDKNNNKNIYYKKNIMAFDIMKFKDYIMEKKSNISELVIFEKDINSLQTNYITVYVYPITEIETETMFYNIKKINKIISYPVLIAINKNFSLGDLKIIIFNKLKYALMKQFQEQNDSIEICYPHFSGSWENYKIKEGKCPVCQKSYVKGENFCCLMEFLDKSTTIENLLEKQGKNRTLILFAKSVLYGENKYIYKGMNLFLKKNNEIETREIISLYDSLDLFSSSKTTDEEKWFCKNCKQKRQFIRTKCIYKSPIYLILKLNRNINQGKIDKFIEYKEMLDLKEYVKGPDKINSIYDLYAVLLHRKSLNGTCYFCYCYSFGFWISFSLDGIEQIENPISKDAYILFYKKRNAE